MLCDDAWHRMPTLQHEYCPSCGGAKWGPTEALARRAWHLAAVVPLFLRQVWRSAWEAPTNVPTMAAPWGASLTFGLIVAMWVVTPLASAAVQAIAPAARESSWSIVGAELVGDLGWLVLVWGCLRARRARWTALGLRAFSVGAAFRYLCVCWLASLAIFQLMTLAIHLLAPSLQLAEPYLPSVARPIRGTATFEVRMAALVLAIVVGPFFEEILFRGMIFAAFARRLGAGTSAFCSSVLFGALHPDPYAALHAFLFGFVACWLYWRLGSLWPAVFFHAAGNLLASL
jgi:membrane protease YdiL (CAAX protease family)